jgi:oxygen-independent coproporphyrinogen-3 oxidase
VEEKIVQWLTPHVSTPPPLSLYIHLPWCIRKCPYCDFNSHGADAIPETAYVQALSRDLELSLPLIWGRKIHSVFFGGGTPSLFSPDGIDRILTTVRTLTQLEPLAEITLEANPGTVEAGRFRGYREAGVTRVSLGIQSFQDELLSRIGRIHDGREAKHAVELAAATFETFNLDLMYALPGQTQAQLELDIETALSFQPPHLSCYHLTLEPNTPFGHAPPANMPDDEASSCMQHWLEACLADAGFDHYETSAFARPRQHCRHNLNYWTFGDYLGIGAGAHGKLSFHDRIIRQMRVKHPAQYMQTVAKAEHVAETRELTLKDLPFEFMMNALRLTDGVQREWFMQRTGIPLSSCACAINSAVNRGLLEQDPARLKPTQLGRRFLNDLLTLFL